MRVMIKLMINLASLGAFLRSRVLFALTLATACCSAAQLQAQVAGFDTNWTSSISVPNSSNQISFSSLPVTNVTQATASFVSSSTPTNVTGFVFNTNLGLTGSATNVTNNLILNFTPGTFTNNVTNVLQITITNAPSSTGAVTNLSVVVTPPVPGPPYLEVRFYNSSTNPPSEVYILPVSSSAGFGNGFWWSNSTATNNWTNWMFTTTNMTVSLADLGVAGTNSQGRPYYAFYTTNFPNAAWYLSYGGGALPPKTNNAGQWDGTTVSGVGQNGGRPAASSTNAIWFGSEWTPFELTLSGNAADKCDTTYINEFSIPMVVRALTNSPANAQLGIFPSNSLAFYQVGG